MLLSIITSSGYSVKKSLPPDYTSPDFEFPAFSDPTDHEAVTPINQLVEDSLQQQLLRVGNVSSKGFLAKLDGGSRNLIVKFFLGHVTGGPKKNLVKFLLDSEKGLVKLPEMMPSDTGSARPSLPNPLREDLKQIPLRKETIISVKKETGLEELARLRDEGFLRPKRPDVHWSRQSTSLSGLDRELLADLRGTIKAHRLGRREVAEDEESSAESPDREGRDLVYEAMKMRSGNPAGIPPMLDSYKPVGGGILENQLMERRQQQEDGGEGEGEEEEEESDEDDEKVHESESRDRLDGRHPRVPPLRAGLLPQDRLLRRQGILPAQEQHRHIPVPRMRRLVHRAGDWKLRRLGDGEVARAVRDLQAPDQVELLQRREGGGGRQLQDLGALPVLPGLSTSSRSGQACGQASRRARPVDQTNRHRLAKQTRDSTFNRDEGGRDEEGGQHQARAHPLPHQGGRPREGAGGPEGAGGHQAALSGRRSCTSTSTSLTLQGSQAQTDNRRLQTRRPSSSNRPGSSAPRPNRK
ncbi:unnamed protein product [Sphagnum tenellum]